MLDEGDAGGSSKGSNRRLTYLAPRFRDEWTIGLAFGVELTGTGSPSGAPCAADTSGGYALTP